MTHTKPLAIILALAGIIIWLAGIIIWLVYLTWIAPISVKYWQYKYIEALEEQIKQDKELDIYRIDMAKRQVHDERTWNDTVIWLESGESLWIYEGEKIMSIPDTLDTLGVE